MRVLQVIRPAAGGMRRHLSLLCRGLMERGIHVAVAAPPRFTLEDGSEVEVFEANLSSRPNPYADLRVAEAVRRHLHNYDLLHAHGIRAAQVASIAARRADKPFVWTAHNLAPRSGWLPRLIVHRALTGAAAAIAVSHAVARSFASFSIPASRFVVIPNGIDILPFGELGVERPRSGVPPGHLRVAALGRLSPEKGFLDLIDAAAYVHAQCPNVSFVIAGDGLQRKELEERIVSLSLAPAVTLAGRIDDVPAFMAAADTVAVPSLEEGQGIVALEAMAARRPVVATRAGGLVETVMDGETGLLVPPRAPKEMATALLTLMEDGDARKRMGEAGRARVEQLYTLDRMVEGTVAVYEACLSRAPRH